MGNLYLEQAFMLMHDDDGSIGRDNSINNAWPKKKAALLREICDNADASIPKTKKNQKTNKSIHHHHDTTPTNIDNNDSSFPSNDDFIPNNNINPDDENNNNNDIFRNNAKPKLHLQQFDPFPLPTTPSNYS